MLTVSEIAFQNDVGGTEILKGPFQVKIIPTSKRHDYETGTHFTGRLTNPDDIEKARLAGITGYSKSKKAYKPGPFYISEFNILKETT